MEKVLAMSNRLQMFLGGITAPEMYVCGKKFSVMHMRGSAPAKNSAQAKRGSLFSQRVRAAAIV